MDEEGLSLIEIIALNVVRTGSDRTNFKILEMVEKGMDKDRRTRVEDIIEKTGLTKVPVNVRINRLEKVGLVKRWRGTGIIMLTELGKIFIEAINRSEDIVRDKLMEMLKNLSGHNKY